MYLTQKIRIYPTEEQKQVLWDLSEKIRLIYNFGLADRIEDWKENRDKPKEERNYITYTDQQNNLPSIKMKYPEYNWVYSKVYQMTLKKLNSDYKSFLALWKNGDTKARPPRFKAKKRFVTLCYNQSGFKVDEDNIRFSHMHPSKTSLNFQLKYPYKGSENIKQVEIKKESNK